MPSPLLTIEAILALADAWHAQHERWPRAADNPEWRGIDMALRRGHRGLTGGSSLGQLLAQRRGVRNVNRPPALTVEQILAWAREHRRRKRCWPTERSGPIVSADGDTWLAIDMALRKGHRGLLGGSSLARLLAEQLGARNEKALPRLRITQILTWVDAHQRRTGHWPHVRSGPIHDAPGETWSAVESALARGSRGLPGGDSLYRLLRRFRQIPARGSRR